MTDPIGLLSQVLLAPFSEPDSRTWWPALLLSFGVAVLVTGGVRSALAPELWLRRSSLLDLQLLIARRALAVLLPIAWLGLAWRLGVEVARGLDRWLGQPPVPELPAWLLSAGYTLLLFVAWDASRWLLHRLMHEVPLLWQFHQVHHSADVLTPLSFHRVHPVESVLYGLRGALVSGVLAGLFFWLWRGAAVEATVLGVNAIGLVLNAATGNLRHSHVWLRFPVWLERWLLSPAQHQLHHGLQREQQDSNHGTWLACWDRLAGTWRPSPERRVALGLPEAERNHGDDLLSVLLGPIGASARLVAAPVARFSAAMLALLPGLARGQAPAEAHPTEESSAPRDQEEPGEEVVVVAPRGVPYVGGSAYSVSEEELKRWGYDDAHRMLIKVPGVNVRGEDGFGLRPNIGMRGGNSDRSAKIALMQDGLPLAPAPYAAPAAYYFPLASRFVGLDVFKGAGAIRHGPQTIGGAIDVLTRPVPTERTVALDLGVGLRSTAEAHGFVGLGNDKLGLLLEGAHLSTRGFKKIDGGGNTGFSRQDLSLKLAARNGQSQKVRHEVTLALGYGHEASNETYLGLSTEDFADTPYRRYAASALDHMQWHHTEESLAWRLGIGRSLELRTTAYHRWLGRKWTKLNRFSGGPDLHDLLQLGGGGQSEVYLAVLRGEEDSQGTDQQLMIGTNDRTFHNGGLQTVAEWRREGKTFGSTLELGARLHLDDVVRLHTESPHAMIDGRPVATDEEQLTTLDAHTTARALSLYAAEDARLGPLHLLPGVRIESIRTLYRSPLDPQPQRPGWQQVVLPGAGLYVSLLPWLDVLGGVHRGFSPAAPGSDPEVKPELAWSSEAGLRLEAGQSRAEAIGFLSDYDNLTGACTLSGGCVDNQLDQQFNGGEARVYGLEALASHAVLLPHHLSVGASATWTWTRATFQTGFVSQFPQWGQVVVGDGLPYVPEHQGTASLVAEHPRGGLAISATGRSAMRDQASQGDLGPDATDPGRIPGYLQFDASIHAWVTERVKVHLDGTNLTNAVVLESWRPFGARPAAPFQLSLGVSMGQPR